MLKYHNAQHALWYSFASLEACIVKLHYSFPTSKLVSNISKRYANVRLSLIFYCVDDVFLLSATSTTPSLLLILDANADKAPFQNQNAFDQDTAAFIHSVIVV